MLNQEQFKQDLKSVYIAVRNSNSSEEDTLEMFTDLMAKTIVKHIKTLEIVYSNGLTAPNGPVSGTLNHTVK